MLRPVGSQTTERLNNTASASVPRPPSYPHLSLLLRGLKPEPPPSSLQGVVRREGSGDHRGVSMVSVRGVRTPPSHLPTREPFTLWARAAQGGACRHTRTHIPRGTVLTALTFNDHKIHNWLFRVMT